MDSLPSTGRCVCDWACGGEAGREAGSSQHWLVAGICCHLKLPEVTCLAQVHRSSKPRDHLLVLEVAEAEEAQHTVGRRHEQQRRRNNILGIGVLGVRHRALCMVIWRVKQSPGTRSKPFDRICRRG